MGEYAAYKDVKRLEIMGNENIFLNCKKSAKQKTRKIGLEKTEKC